jgi:hypothetical protein
LRGAKKLLEGVHPTSSSTVDAHQYQSIMFKLNNEISKAENNVGTSILEEK